jgi:hypothetical protein
MNIYEMSFDDLAMASVEATLLAAAQPLPEKQALALLILDAVELANIEMHIRTFDGSREEAERDYRRLYSKAKG